MPNVTLPTAAAFRKKRDAYVVSLEALETERKLFLDFINANPAALTYKREIHKTLAERLEEELKGLGWYGSFVQGAFQLTL